MARAISFQRVDPQAEINITPLIDVMLALLVIFMIAAPVVTRQITLPLAGSDTPAQTDPAVLKLSIMDTGEWYLDGIAVSRASLAERLQRTVQAAAEAPVLEVRAQAAAAYDDVANALAIARSSGMTHLRMAPAVP
ncbi:ExbD/TolR family protein [Dokdonella koreensis]|uniref:Biopolymer transport protein ExbD/TolR n=1 Tax=Dokdonella koreensis DS-123 TaxID=1300342 RepID=A0A167HC39_9GAMM|nr:biopolymer transporter ExbD [Dokdonella koreensis]ANB19796.1 Biopolymer transport protein ExbD/TolR [Dokdonella koreensis DS-123]